MDPFFPLDFYLVGGLLGLLAGVVLFLAGVVSLIWKRKAGLLLLSLPIGGAGLFFLKIAVEASAAC